MKLLVQPDKEFRSALYDIMGFYPHNVEYYRIAFAHKSQEYKSKKTGDRPLNNERLEFLGDAVLETVVSDIVYHHFQTKREGFLTNTRSKIVSRESLGKLAKDLGIDRLIRSHTNSRAHNSFLAGNAFEALMGAIYLDRGFDYAFRFIEHRIMGSVLDLEGVAHKEVNFKSKLLEWSQKNRIHIDFKDKQTAGKDGSAPTFFCTIVLEGIFAGDGKGFSKKEAHQNASKEALLRMKREPRFIDEIFGSKEKRTAMEASPCFVLPAIDGIDNELDAPKAAPKKEAPEHRDPKPAPAPKPQPKKEQPKKQPKPAPAPKKEEAPAPEPTPQPAPKVEAPAPKPEPKAEAPVVEEPAPAPVQQPEATVPVVSTTVTPAPAPEPEPTPAPAAKKPRRGRGKRQNAAGFTNTDTIPAETSHRAEKAARKVEEAKKEKARKEAKKTARKAAKGIEAAAAVPADASAATASAADASAATASAAPAPAPAKKPRRRRKTKAELPSETPAPEREQAIRSAEDAAYSMSAED